MHDNIIVANIGATFCDVLTNFRSFQAKSLQLFILASVAHNFLLVFYASFIFGRPFVQEGQHPLTGQRAANFRPLANQ